MPQDVESCVEPTAGPIEMETVRSEEKLVSSREGGRMEVARVGQQAPDFEASSYITGEGFENVRLSDFQGQWVVLCFYPGDFTFV